MTEYYTVKAKIENSVLSKTRVNFDVREHSKVWVDPTYGNGGGSYEDSVKVVGTFLSEHEAVHACICLNKYNGSKIE